MPLHLHENRQETQARIPHDYCLFAPFGDDWIHQRPWVLARQSQKNHAPIRANLRRGDAPPIPRRFSPIRQRVCEILHPRPNLRCGRVFHLLCCLAQSRISQLQHCSNRHVLPPLRASAFGACLNPVAAPPFYLNSFFAFLCLRVLCVKSPPVFPTCEIPLTGTPPQSPPYSQSHLPAAPELHPPHESPARTRLLARYIGCKWELVPSLLRCPGRLSRHQQEFRTAGRSAH